MEILYLFIAGTLSFLTGWFIAVSKNNKQQAATDAKLSASQLMQQEQTQRLTDMQTQLNALQDSLTEKVRLLSIAETKQQQSEKLLSEKDMEIKDLNQKLTTEFENIANRILDSKSEKLSDVQGKWLKEVLNPLKEQIEKFENKVHSTHNESVQLTTALRTQVDILNKQSNEISKEAHNLVNALKGSVKAQGNWGEMILEKILERSGLTRDREFRVQESLNSEDGRRLQPDVVVLLPENKSVVIDSKVSLIAYEQYAATEDEAQRQIYLKQHIQSIRAHIKGLSEKKYQQLYQLNTVDFVLMFLPVEPAFALAVQHDNDLWSEAFEKNIVLVSTSTLLATLRTISMMWRQDRMNKNALEIARQSGALYDKFVGYITDMIDVGKRLDNAKESYSTAMNKLSTGNGNIVKRLEEIKKLGANSSKQLPSTLIDRSDS